MALAPGMYRDAATGRLVQSAALLQLIQCTLILQYFAAYALRHVPKWRWTVQQHLSLAFELSAPLLFTLRRLRPVAFAVGIGFHLIIALFMTSEEWRAVGVKAAGVWRWAAAGFNGGRTPPITAP